LPSDLPFHTPQGSLTCRKTLRHCPHGFTFHPKEVLRRNLRCEAAKVLTRTLEPLMMMIHSIIKDRRMLGNWPCAMPYIHPKISSLINTQPLKRNCSNVLMFQTNLSSGRQEGWCNLETAGFAIKRLRSSRTNKASASPCFRRWESCSQSASVPLFMTTRHHPECNNKYVILRGKLTPQPRAVDDLRTWYLLLLRVMSEEAV
jgi:hypothetical protein